MCEIRFRGDLIGVTCGINRSAHSSRPAFSSTLNTDRVSNQGSSSQLVSKILVRRRHTMQDAAPFPAAFLPADRVQLAMLQALEHIEARDQSRRGPHMKFSDYRDGVASSGMSVVGLGRRSGVLVEADGMAVGYSG